MDKMTSEQARDAAEELTQWAIAGDSLEWERGFPSFMDAVAFVNKVAEVAEAAGHHPDIYNHWRTIRLVLTTHDVGGLTELDFELAKRIEGVLRDEV